MSSRSPKQISDIPGTVWVISDKELQTQIRGGAGLKEVLGNMIPGFDFGNQGRTILMAMMGAKGELQTIAVEYFRVTLIGTTFWIYGLALNMLIRAEGKMKTAAVMIAVGLVIDIILKPIGNQYL